MLLDSFLVNVTPHYISRAECGDPATTAAHYLHNIKDIVLPLHHTHTRTKTEEDDSWADSWGKYLELLSGETQRRAALLQLFVYVPPGSLCNGKFIFFVFLTLDFPTVDDNDAVDRRKKSTDGRETRKRRGGSESAAQNWAESRRLSWETSEHLWDWELIGWKVTKCLSICLFVYFVFLLDQRQADWPSGTTTLKPRCVCIQTVWSPYTVFSTYFTSNKTIRLFKQV